MQSPSLSASSRSPAQHSDCTTVSPVASSYTTYGSPASDHNARVDSVFSSPFAKPPLTAQSDKTTPPAPKRSLKHQVLNLDPPASVKNALDDMQEARQRLNMQIFYAARSSFLSGTYDGNDTGNIQVRILHTARLKHAVQYLIKTGKLATMRAVIVLLDNELAALTVLSDWLLDRQSIEPACAEQCSELRRYATKTGDHLKQAKRTVISQLIPDAIKPATTWLRVQRIDLSLTQIKTSIHAQASALGGCKQFRAEIAGDKEVRELAEVEIRSSLDSVIKDLAMTKLLAG